MKQMRKDAEGIKAILFGEEAGVPELIYLFMSNRASKSFPHSNRK